MEYKENMVILPEEMVCDPLMKCMYCFGSFERGDLSSEHVIPKSLGGTIVIPNSVCEKCRVITSKAEADCISRDGVFYAAKEHLRLPSRSRRRNRTSRPEALPLGEFDGDFDNLHDNMGSANFNWEYIPIEKHPFSIVLLKLHRAGILVGREASENFGFDGMGMYMDGGMPAAGDGRIRAYLAKFNPLSFCRFVGKVAYGAAVAQFGLSGFLPIIIPALIGSDRFLSSYVGSSGFSSSRRRLSLHRIVMFFYRGYLVAEVQLFSRFGCQVYEVVVGRELPRGHL